jgi:hypothetical protein
MLREVSQLVKQMPNLFLHWRLQWDYYFKAPIKEYSWPRHQLSLNCFNACGRRAIRLLSTSWSVLYNELHRIASRQMRAERDNHTLQTTALVHDEHGFAGKLPLSSVHSDGAIRQADRLQPNLYIDV